MTLFHNNVATFEKSHITELVSCRKEERRLLWRRYLSSDDCVDSIFLFLPHQQPLAVGGSDREPSSQSSYWEAG